MSENKSAHFFFKMLLNLAPLFPQKNGLVAPKKMCGHQQHGFKSQVEFPRLELHKRHSSTKPCSQPQPQQPQPQPQPWSCFTACGSFWIYIKQKKTIGSSRLIHSFSQKIFPQPLDDQKRVPQQTRESSGVQLQLIPPRSIPKKRRGSNSRPFPRGFV